MHQCRTTYSKALLLSVMVHVAVVGSAIAFAQYGGSLFNGAMRTITVSLLGNIDTGRPGNVPFARAKQGVSVQLRELLKSGSMPDLQKDGETMVKATPAAGTGVELGKESAGTEQRSTAPVEEGYGKGGGISREQWDLVHAALERSKTYPRMARERGVEGVVLVRFRVLPTGEIEKVDIMQSSGSDILDTASVRTVYRAAPMPYVSGWIEVPISYVLK